MRRWRRSASEFDAGRADETETAAAIRAAWREAGDLVDPAYRGGAGGGRSRHPGFENSQHRAVDRACREISRCGGSGLRRAAGTAGLARGSDDEAGTHQGHEERPGRSRTVRALGQPRREARSCRMSVDVTKLPSGLTVITDSMPHLETAALGVWAGVGGRDEKPNEHGISHLLEHMAFKGTTRRSSREIVEEIEAVGGDLNAGTSTETTAYYARVMKADVPLALDVLVRHSRQSLLRAGRTGARKERHRAGDRRGAGYARRRGVRASQRTVFPGSADGPLAAGHGKDPEGVRSRHAARLSVDALSRSGHGGGGRRRGRSQAGGRGGGAAVRQLRRHAGAEAAGRDVRQGRLPRGASRPRAGASDAGAGGGAADRSVAVLAAGLHQHARRRDVVAAVPGSARKARAVLLDLHLPCAL